MSADEEDDQITQIKEAVKTNDVLLFMKGTPDSPRCGFSATVVQILDYLNVTFSAVNVLEDESLREKVKEFSDWPTIPQLYVKGEFVGGCDIIRGMMEEGELITLFDQKKINYTLSESD
jgi:monothiol glutaredoxin